MAGWNWLRRIVLRPSLWTAIITVVAYWDDTALHGSFVYDDGGSVKSNVVVNGQRPWREVFVRDYWGTLMSEPQSHKSFRPITTLTFRGNWILAEWMQKRNSGKSDTGTIGTASSSPVGEFDTFYFHLVNLILHAIVTALVTEASAFVFQQNHDGDDPHREIRDTGAVTARLLTGLIFGLHPVHVEAVTNITSRGELFMSVFFLLAFILYASNLPESKSSSAQPTRFSVSATVSIYVLPWICMALSVFSKEQGATTLVSLLIYDFIHNHVSIKEFMYSVIARPLDRANVAFLRRAVVLTVQSAIVAIWRYRLNGELSPDFVYAQNPAGFAAERFTRVFSVPWIYCLYVWDVIYPANLCPDWSGHSIDLIETPQDPRILGVLAIWTGTAVLLYSLCFGMTSASASRHADVRRIVLIAFFAFLFSPFLLSSNLLVVIGLMKADRVIYLPLTGFSILMALLFKSLFFGMWTHQDKMTSTVTVPSRSPSTNDVTAYALTMFTMFAFCAKLHERNVAWSSCLNLWMPAYRINNRSTHTIYNCGYELSLKLRYAEAEQVLRPIGDPHVEGPSNTFIYVMVLYNLQRCDEANEYIDEAFLVLDELQIAGGVRNTASSLARTRSNLLVAQGFCAGDILQTGQIMYRAVQADPSNQYAIDQATNVAKHIESAQQMNELRARQHHI